MNLFPASFLLGLAGFDIASIPVILAAVSAKCSRKDIVLMTTVSTVATVLLGILLSKFLGDGVSALTTWINGVPDRAYAIVGIFAGVGLLYWCMARVFGTHAYQAKEKKKESFFVKFVKRGMFLMGLIYTIWIISDPTFWALVAIASQADNLLLIILGFLVWLVVGQFPLYALTALIATNKHEKVFKVLNRGLDKNKAWQKLRRIFGIVLSAAILAAGVYFLVDSVYYLAQGSWLY